MNPEHVASAKQETLNEVVWLLDRLKAMSACTDEHIAESLEHLARGYRQFHQPKSVTYGKTGQREA